MIVRTFCLCSSLAVLVSLGCGKAEVANSTPDQSPDRDVTAATGPSPIDVVSQFLDQIRRGGEDSRAGRLLTQKAQSELRRIGRSIEPIGSPDAQYRVTRGEPVPGEKDSMLVHSFWTDPLEAGGQAEYQVVWAVVRESVGWRISGMAIQERPDQDPIIVDFENGDLMAQVLSGTGQDAKPQQAASPAETMQR